MEDSLKDLLLSTNMDDVKLGVILCREKHILPTEIDKFVDEYAHIMVKNLNVRTPNHIFQEVFDKYLHRGTTRGAETGFQYVKWKEENE